MSEQMLEKGDIIALKNGRRVEVLSVKMDGNSLLRFDYLDRTEASPMRRTEYPSAIGAMLQKVKVRTPDPLAERSYDNRKPAPQEVIVVNGKEYIEKSGTQKPTTDNINHDAGQQAHKAVKEPPKPIETRIKPVPTGKGK